MNPGRQFITTAVSIFSPLLIMAVWALLRGRRQMASARCDATSFATTPYVVETPLSILRSCPVQERLYLRDQLKVALAMYGFMSWIVAGLLSAFALTASAPYAMLWSDPSVRVWYSLLSITDIIGIAFLIFPVIFAVGFILPLRVGVIARFYLTRPISMRVLFWSRVVFGMAALVGGIFTGVCVTLGLVWAFKGAVWQHLPSAVPGKLGPDCGCVSMYTNMLVTSAPRLFLSMLTTAALFYSTSVALLAAPVNRKIASGAPVSFFFLFGGMFAVLALRFFQIASHRQFSLVPRQLFVYADFGPPPPYSYALVPVALTIGLLLLSRGFVNRLEV